ncbi:MAG TPA: hypothetical protein VFP10_13660 [Candidatus Eisenbacteria bacterium]|nr:hypothetical protein [Candidatus Eisenbacteria bacterium]
MISFFEIRAATRDGVAAGRRSSLRSNFLHTERTNDNPVKLRAVRPDRIGNTDAIQSCPQTW